MTSAILVPWAQTDWQAEGRMSSSTPINLNDEGRRQVAEWAPKIGRFEPVAVYSADKGPGEETGQLLAETLKMKHKKTPRFHEVKLGLWEGRTAEELAKRFSKTYKQWKENPSSVCPPDGEYVSAAVEGLVAEIHRLAAKRKDECFVVVLGPLAFAAVRCALEGKGYDEMWALSASEPIRYLLQAEQDRPVPTTTGSTL